MKQLLKAEDLVGKTVAQAAIQTWDNWVGLRFTDDTYIIIEASQSYDSVDVEILGIGDVEDYKLRDLGVISEEELQTRTAREKARLEQSVLDRERAEFERLAAKFLK